MRHQQKQQEEVVSTVQSHSPKQVMPERRVGGLINVQTVEKVFGEIQKRQK